MKAVTFPNWIRIDATRIGLKTSRWPQCSPTLGKEHYSAQAIILKRNTQCPNNEEEKKKNVERNLFLLLLKLVRIRRSAVTRSDRKQLKQNVQSATHTRMAKLGPVRSWKCWCGLCYHPKQRIRREEKETNITRALFGVNLSRFQTHPLSSIPRGSNVKNWIWLENFALTHKKFWYGLSHTKPRERYGTRQSARFTPKRES